MVENVATQLPRQAVPQPAVPWVPLPSVGPAAIPGRFDECLLPDWPIHQTAQHAAYRDPRFTVNQVVNTSDYRYKDPYHRSVCVFHESAEGFSISEGGVRFGLSRFPFALCHLALFCCPSLGANLEPERIDALMTQFATRARHLNRVSQPFMMLGNGSHASKAKFTVLLNDLAAGVLAQDGVDWYKAWNYTGIVLRWPDDTTAEAWHRMAPVLRQLSRQLASRGRNLRLGVALRQDSYGSDLERIAAKLGKTYLFLLPPSMEGKYYEHTLRYFSERTLGTLDDLNLRFLSRNLTGYQCYLFPADTYTYRINPPDMTHSLGPGIRGPVTNYAGRMAYFETCKISSTYSKHIASYGVEAVRDDSLLAYTEPQLLGRFADYMHNTLSATCMGIWNPHMDDFGGVCGSGEFPLTGALFRPYNDTHG